MIPTLTLCEGSNVSTRNPRSVCWTASRMNATSRVDRIFPEVLAGRAPAGRLGDESRALGCRRLVRNHLGGRCFSSNPDVSGPPVVRTTTSLFRSADRAESGHRRSRVPTTCLVRPSDQLERGSVGISNEDDANVSFFEVNERADSRPSESREDAPQIPDAEEERCVEPACSRKRLETGRASRNLIEFHQGSRPPVPYPGQSLSVLHRPPRDRTQPQPTVESDRPG